MTITRGESRPNGEPIGDRGGEYLVWVNWSICDPIGNLWAHSSSASKRYPQETPIGPLLASLVLPVVRGF